MTTRRDNRRARFERRARQEERLEKSLGDLSEAVSDLEGVNDIDEVVSGLEGVEKQLETAKRQAERLAGEI